IANLVNLDCLTYAGHLANLEQVAQHPKYVFEQVDLRDKAATLRVVEQHQITHVMHLAAESHVDRSITGPGDFIHTNVVGTFNLLEACRHVWSNRQSPCRFLTFRPTRCLARSVRQAFSRRPPRTRPTRRIQQAKPPATCSCARITTLMVCRR